MGVCQSQKKKEKLETQIQIQSKQFETRTTREIGYKTCQNSPIDKKLPRSFPSTLNEGNLVTSRQRKPISIQRIQNIINFANTGYMSPLLETVASKKFTIIGQHKSNNHIQIVQNNKTGKLVLMENIQKQKECNEKYIGWLQKVYLDHPNIIKVIEIHQDKQNYQVVFENFEGLPLSDLIYSGAKVQKKIVSQICCQLLQILQYLHQKNIIHGNLTMRSFEYIMQDDKYLVKLVNLKGIIIKEENNIEIIKLLPPEYLYKQNLFTQERDLWAVGIIVLSLRKGQLPYGINIHSQLYEILVIIKNHQFNFKKKKDQVYREFLESILNKDPQCRKDSDWLLNHKFITDYKIKETSQQEIILSNFLKQKPCCTILQMILSFFAQEFCWADFLVIQKLFLEGDQDMDGLLSKSELKKLIKSYIKIDNLDDKINQIFNAFEIKNNEGINSNQFMALAIDRQQLLTPQNIEASFQIFSFGKAEITLRGLKRHLLYESVNLKHEFSELTNDYNSLNAEQFQLMLVSILN